MDKEVLQYVEKLINMRNRLKSDLKKFEEIKENLEWLEESFENKSKAYLQYCLLVNYIEEVLNEK